MNFAGIPQRKCLQVTHRKVMQNYWVENSWKAIEDAQLQAEPNR